MEIDPFDLLPPFRYRSMGLYDIEDVEKYAPGGFHPVDIGEIISSAKCDYEVVHKLGHGGCATVWLVRSGAQSTSYHALKILCADDADYPNHELAVLEHLKKVARAGHPNVVDLHDSFKLSGPNGEHQCLVFPVLGPKVEMMNNQTMISGPVRHDICRQVASAAAFLHDHGVCHGDLTPYNIVFELPNIESMTLDGFFQLLGPIQSQRLLPAKGQGRYSPHGPKHIVESPDFSTLDIASLTRVRIIDLGQAFFVDQPPKFLGTPIDFFPPELCFDFLPSPKSDIWQLACVFYHIYTGDGLFPIGFRIFLALIGDSTECLGPIPRTWRGKFNFEEYGYYESNKLITSTEPERWYEDTASKTTMHEKLAEDAPHLSANQRKAIAELLLDMLAYAPEKRISALEVLRRLETSLQREVTDDSTACRTLSTSTAGVTGNKALESATIGSSGTTRYSSSTPASHIKVDHVSSKVP